MKGINNRDLVEKELLKVYDDIDGLAVIEECLLFKGVEICGTVRSINIKHLEHTAHILYGLKVNATNKLYVGFYLDRFYKRAQLVTSSGSIKVPNDIYDRVKELNDSYKTKANQIDE